MDTTPSKIDFYGSYELFQNPDFAKIFAASLGLQVIQSKGLVFLSKKYPVIGCMNAMLGNPEIHGPFVQWQETIHDINFSSLKVITSERIYQWEKYLISPLDTFNMLLDLSKGEEVLLAGVKKRCRSEIRKGEKKGVIVAESQDDHDLDYFYQIILKTSQMGRLFDIYPYIFYHKLLRTKYAKLFIAKYNGHAVGAIFFLLSRHMHGLQSGINKEEKLPIAYPLYYRCALWGMKNGYKYFDFGLQGLKDNENLLRFKSSFNPVLKPGYVYQVPGSWIKRFMVTVRNKFRKRQLNLTGTISHAGTKH